MKTIKSWRWSRLGNLAILKNVLSRYEIWTYLVALAVIGLVLITSPAGDDSTGIFLHQMLMLCFWFGIIVLFYTVLEKICMADDYCEIPYEHSLRRVYIYNLKKGLNEHEIIIKQENTESRIIVEGKYQQNGYEIFRNEQLAILLFYPKDEQQWFYLSQKTAEPVFLGQRLDKTLFISKKDRQTAQTELSVIKGQNAVQLTAEKFVWEQNLIYVSPLSAEKIKRLYDTFWLETKAPDKYLIICNDGDYETYGLYEKGIPNCEQIQIPSLIFQELQERVVLVWNGFAGNGYGELCRKKTITRPVNDMLVELTDDYRVGGNVWQFDEQKQQLKKCYSGNFYAIGFEDGSIIGEDWEYTSEDKDKPRP